MSDKFPQTQLYLGRKSYRQRRLRDGARVLPIAGAILLIMPLIASEPATGTTGLYIFGVWTILIVIAAGISARLRDEPEQLANADTQNTDP